MSKRRRVDFRLPSELVDELDKWCDGQVAETTRTGAVEGAIRKMLEDHPVKKRKKR